MVKPATVAGEQTGGCESMTSPCLNVASRRYAVTQLEERAFDGEEEDGGGGVNADLDTDESRGRCQRDVVGGAELGDEMDDEFLDEVGAVSNTGDESGAGNPYSAKGQARTDGADKERGHAERDERELPDASGDGESVGVAEV